MTIIARDYRHRYYSAARYYRAANEATSSPMSVVVFSAIAQLSGQHLSHASDLLR